MNDELVITQVLPTIQGEGPSAGKPTLLIRFKECNLFCNWCDTKWSNNIKIDNDVLLKNPIINVIDRNYEKDIHSFFKYIKILLLKNNINKLMFTGGEPLIESEFINNLLIYLFDNNVDIVDVEIETNGTLIVQKLDDLNIFHDIIHLNISPKLQPECYKDKKSFENIIILFKQIQTFLSKSCCIKYIYKFVHKKEWENDILKIIHTLKLQDNIYILPFTPIKHQDPIKNDLDVTRKYTIDTIDFVINNDLIFSPRIHLYIFDNKNETINSSKN